MKKKIIVEGEICIDLNYLAYDIPRGITPEKFQAALLEEFALCIVEGWPEGADIGNLLFYRMSPGGAIFRIEREETDAEFQERVRKAELTREKRAAAAARRSEMARLKKEEAERKLYEKLKAKFDISGKV
jgi:hypothetical protein